MNRALVIGLALIALLACRAPAAQPALEGFASGANGWAGSSERFTGAWTFTGGVARAVFSNTGGIPFPDICILSNAPAATSGSFTGNYDAVGIDAIGFSFFAPSALPASSVVELEWAGGTSVYRRGFSVTQTGVWYYFTASLKDEDQGQWEVIAGSSNNFTTACQSVSRVALRVARSMVDKHEFLIDDVFAARTPDAASAASDRVIWEGLLTGVGYQVQSTTNLIAGAWTLRESLIATGSVHATVLTNAPLDHQSLRIRFN